MLLIDDQISDTSAEVRYLRDAGFQVLSVQSGEAGLRARVGVIRRDVLDLRLPGLSGFEVLVELTARNNRIPVVVLTAFGTMERAIAAMKLGAADVLQKPVDLEDMEQRLHDLRAMYPICRRTSDSTRTSPCGGRRGRVGCFLARAE